MPHTELVAPIAAVSEPTQRRAVRRRKTAALSSAVPDALLQVRLNGKVLLRAEERGSVDALLLAVPLCITDISSAASTAASSARLGGDLVSAGSQPRSSATTRRSIKQLSPSDMPTEESRQEFVHFFPSLSELQRSHATADTARRYLVRLIRNLEADGWTFGDSQQQQAPWNGQGRQPQPSDVRVDRDWDVRERLKDPHLLLYLSTVLDHIVFRSLCEALVTPLKGVPLAIPVDVQIALQMLRESLSTAESHGD